jgi:glycosyltransferase involved in cell wall biosynthesis
MLSMGLPLISFGTPELAKIVLENENGIIVDGCDYKSLEKSIITASNFDSIQKLQFSRNSIELSKKIFSPNFIANQFLEDL